MIKFRINLKRHHDKSGKSVYRVAKDTGLNRTTITRYLDKNRLHAIIPADVVILAKYYGADWHECIETVDADDTEEDTITPLIA